MLSGTMDALVRTTFRGSVGEVWLQRSAKRNALTRSLLQQLRVAVSECLRHDRVRVMVLGADGPTFCAGMDLAEMESRARATDGAGEWLADSRLYAEVLQMMVAAPFPTIACVQGPALAGGVGLVLACDLVVATHDVFFSLPEPSRGIVAAMVTPLLVGRIGLGPAAAMLLSGQRFDAVTAQRWGLCLDVVAGHSLRSRTDEIVHSILQGAPEALAITKSFLHACSGEWLDHQWEKAITVSATARQSDAAREGLQAFLEKRKPRWQEPS